MLTSHQSIVTPFPIDIVYTWVNGTDPNWLELFDLYFPEKKSFPTREFQKRFLDIEELRFSLRSIETYAPWCHQIFIVVHDHQRPLWINQNHPKLNFISHSQIFPSNATLPTFNSNAIELMLHNIPGLSEHFLYFNDDFFLHNPTTYKDFFTDDGKPRILVGSTKWKTIDRAFAYFSRKYLTNKNSGSLFHSLVFNTLKQFQSKFGKVFEYSYSHQPIPLTKSLLHNMTRVFFDGVNLTLSHRYRDITDFSMQSLAIQYGCITNAIVPVTNSGNFSYFAMIYSKSQLSLTYDLIMKSKLVCINVDYPPLRNVIMALFYILLPYPSSFEDHTKPPLISKKDLQFWHRTAHLTKEQIELVHRID